VVIVANSSGLSGRAHQKLANSLEEEGGLSAIPDWQLTKAHTHRGSPWPNEIRLRRALLVRSPLTEFRREVRVQ